MTSQTPDVSSSGHAASTADDTASGVRNVPGVTRAAHGRQPGNRAWLVLASLGVVFGDIGTSPLYAVKECFHGLHAVALTQGNLYGVMSLIFWSLTMVVTVKYVTFVMRAHNHGEGGILALAALSLAEARRLLPPGAVNRWAMLGIFGAALLYGDAVITPAISVLSALEGLQVATPEAGPLVLPLACAVLLGLFMVQHLGTARIGALFGPVMLLWFVTLALLGARELAGHPQILQAMNPAWAVEFFLANHRHGLVVLGSVVLCITGGEALYADMGHFGAGPIRLSWCAVVFPALLLNYFGQCALLLDHPEAAVNPFYALAPRALVYPLVALSTLATIIASQAMISGVFSLTRQAIQLGYCPRLRIVHTSGQAKGQIYLPWVNAMMMLACIGLVLTFKESSRLAGAYGIAVTATMTITTLFFFSVTRYRWNWPLWKALGLSGLFLAFDLAFLSGNLLKILDGGWFTLTIALGVTLCMVTWHDGRALLSALFRGSRIPLEAVLGDIAARKPFRLPGTAVFMALSPHGAPGSLLNHLKHIPAIHEQVIIFSVVVAEKPFIAPDKRLKVTPLGEGFYRILAICGFMETPAVPELLAGAASHGVTVDLQNTSFFLGRETLLTTGASRMAGWRKALFGFMSRNAWNVSTFFGIPPDRVIELGSQIEL